MSQNKENPRESRISLTFRQLLAAIAVGALLILVGTGVVSVEKLLGVIK